MIPAAALSALKHWRLIGVGVLVLLIGIQSYRLNSVKVDLAQAERDLGLANMAVRSCNAATDELRRQSEARDREQQDLLRSARRGAQTDRDGSERLRRGVMTPRSGECTISAELRNAQGL